MRQEFLNIIKRYIWKEGTLWAVGYYIGSVGGGVTTGLIKEYIKNQKSEEVLKQGRDSNNTQPRLFD